MSRFTRRLAPPLIVACAGVGLMAGGAQAAAPPGFVSASPTQMTYSANDDTTTITFQRSGDELYVDDAVPLEVGPGCAHVAGDQTRAVCSVPIAPPGEMPIRVTAASGNDTVFNFTDLGIDAWGDAGNDTLHGSVTARDVLVGSNGDDKLVGNGGDDSLYGGGDTDALVGGYGGDYLYDGPGDDVVDGGPGDRDALISGTGTDALDGGAGERDVVAYQHRTDPVRASIGTGYSGVAKEKDMIAESVEDLYGGMSDDVLIGDDRDNLLVGLLGHDTLVGGAGADSIHGGEGDNKLYAFTLDGRVDDGAKDTLFGSNADPDHCVYSTTDPDWVWGCAPIDESTS